MKQKNNIAFWDDAFLKEFEGKRVDEGVLLWYFSGGCYAIRTPRTLLFVDPYFGGDPVDGVADTYRTTQIPLDPSKIREVDMALITHNHYDHCHEDTLKHLVRGTGIQLWGPSSAVPEMLSYGIPSQRIRQVKAGDRFTFRDIQITVWPGYDKDEPEGVTYLVESGGVRIFCNGDGADGPAFDEIRSSGNLDIAILAFGRTWYMSEAQLLRATKRLGPRLLLPIHWELWRGHTGNALELGRLLEREPPGFEVRLLMLGDSVHYTPRDRHAGRG